MMCHPMQHISCLLFSVATLTWLAAANQRPTWAEGGTTFVHATPSEHVAEDSPHHHHVGPPGLMVEISDHHLQMMRRHEKEEMLPGSAKARHKPRPLPQRELIEAGTGPDA